MRESLWLQSLYHTNFEVQTLKRTREPAAHAERKAERNTERRRLYALHSTQLADRLESVKTIRKTIGKSICKTIHKTIHKTIGKSIGRRLFLVE